jgi:hypothetical protein
LTTFAHFSVSSTMKLPKSAGEPGSTEAPNSSNRALVLGLLDDNNVPFHLAARQLTETDRRYGSSLALPVTG